MKFCENCGKPNDGSFISDRFCSDHCRHSYASKIANKKTVKCKICDEYYSKAGIKAHLEKHKRYDEIKNIKYICECCGTKYSYNRNKRFCSKKCARSFSTKAKRKEINDKVSKSLFGNSKKILCKIWIKPCMYCKELYVAKIENGMYCSKSCSTKNNPITENTRKKISKKAKERVRLGTHQGWQSRKIRSYAEKFFEDALIKNNINDFLTEYKIHKKNDLGLNNSYNYFLDFYFPSIKLNLEIDGHQHSYIDRMKSDKFRDSILKEKMNIDTYRIRWRCLNTDRGKDYMKNEIQKFIEFYNNKINSLGGEIRTPEH